MKKPLTPAGIEPVTFRFVAQHLNHCATAVPDTDRGTQKYREEKPVTGSLCAPQIPHGLACNLEVAMVRWPATGRMSHGMTFRK
jgi:hypothetical protein